MQAPDVIAYAIPVFLALIALELAIARRRGRAAYRLQDALADLGCGIGQQAVLVFAGGALLAGYAAIYHRLRVVTFAPGSLVPWLIAFVVVDFAYYWWHRLSHEVNFLWAAHAVHHQSEDYNLAVALRQSILTSFTSLPFYYPMAVLGVPPAAYAAMVAASTLYQFWIHTTLVGRLGWLEAFLNTPAHHRVHHAVNPQYLDRNYGAILIVWDRLFGTFAEEREPEVFGTTKPLASFHPVWAQLQPWFEVAEKARPLARRRDRARLWLSSPARDPRGRPAPDEAQLRARPKHAVPVPRAVQAYGLAQFGPLIAALSLMIVWQSTAHRGPLLLAGGLVFWTLASLGALLDGRPWGVPAELARLVAVAVAVAAAGPALGASRPLVAVAASIAAVGSAGWLLAAARVRPDPPPSCADQPEPAGPARASGGA